MTKTIKTIPCPTCKDEVERYSKTKKYTTYYMDTPPVGQITHVMLSVKTTYYCERCRMFFVISAESCDVIKAAIKEYERKKKDL